MANDTRNVIFLIMQKKEIKIGYQTAFKYNPDAILHIFQNKLSFSLYISFNSLFNYKCGNSFGQISYIKCRNY